MTTIAPPRPPQRAPRPPRRPSRARRGRRRRLSSGIARARPTRRVTIVLVSYLVLTLLIGWRLVSVQVLNADAYRNLGAQQVQREMELPARRGKLYDRSGQPLAMSLPAATIYANPRLLRDGGARPEEVAAQLAGVLDRPASEIDAALRKDTSFTYLGRQLPRAVGDRVSALKLPGVGVLSEPKRMYPAGALAAQVVGFAGVDNVGLSGMETQYDELLSGQPGQQRLERAPTGLTITGAPRELQPAVPGADLVLTLDRAIQFEAERALADAVAKHQAQGATAVVLDVGTREVLAMASAPRLEPTATGEADGYVRRNRSVTDFFEPGSVNKAITISAALEEGVLRPDERFMVPDQIQVGTQQYSDSHGHPPELMDAGTIIEQSSNVGTIQIAQRLGEPKLHEYLARFGYGRPSGLGFPGEAGGLLPDLATWWDSSLPTMAIGQGVSATLLQVAEVFATIGGGGEWMQPTLVRGRVGADGRLEPGPPPARHPVVSPQTAGLLQQMLGRVVDGENGTGELAAVPGYRVGGKTGTAQKPATDQRGYEAGAYIGSFAGFAPAENPQLVVAVAVDEPQKGYYGGSTAAPVFSQIMGFALRQRRVPPSDPAAAPQPVPLPPSPTAVAVELPGADGTAGRTERKATPKEEAGEAEASKAGRANAQAQKATPAAKDSATRSGTATKASAAATRQREPADDAAEKTTERSATRSSAKKRR